MSRTTRDTIRDRYKTKDGLRLPSPTKSVTSYAVPASCWRRGQFRYNYAIDCGRATYANIEVYIMCMDKTIQCRASYQAQSSMEWEVQALKIVSTDRGTR